MPLVRWNDQFETGLRSVDHEHVGLIDVINLLGKHLDPRRGSREVLETLGEIRTLIAAHFGHEEAIMRDIGYDELAEHKADHDRLLLELGDLARSAADRPGLDLRVRLGEQLGRWFERHFKQFDSRFHTAIDGPAGGARE